MKKALSIILCLCMLFTTFPAIAADNGSKSESEPSVDNWSEADVSNSNESLSGYDVDDVYHDDVDDLYSGVTTLYDLKNEVEADTGSEEEPDITDEEDADDSIDLIDVIDFDNNGELSHEYVPDELIVKFVEPWQVPGKEKQLRKEIEKLEKIGFIEGLNMYVIKVADLTKNPNAVINRFKNNKFIEYVTPNHKMAFDYIPNDPSYKMYQNASMNNMNIPAAWDILRGSSSPVVAVIDSGVAYHTDLPTVWSGYSVESGLVYSNDKVGHGTNVAGVIGAIGDNGLGGAGINWNASIMAVKIDDAYGTPTIANVAKGVIWAADNGARIINLSVGTTADNSTLRSAIDYAYNKGCAIFAAAGNMSVSGVDYPARYANVIGVGSGNASIKAKYANYGAGLDVVGASSFFTTTASGGFADASGTSFASPQAAGLASLIWAVNPNLSNKQVYDIIRNTASGKGAYVNDEIGFGLINAGDAIKMALAMGGDAPDESALKQQEIGIVQARTAPVIELDGFTEMTLDFGQPYKESGYKAFDCKRVELTSLVKVNNTVNSSRAGLYTVSYDVVDSAGLTARATRTVTVLPEPVVVKPPTAPKITIIGSNPIILHSTSATPYKEQMARAVDGDGKDISNLVTVSGSISRAVPGTYTLTYKVVSPVSNLSATTTRDVRIVGPKEKRDPRAKYGLSGQAKQGGKITHTGIVSGAVGFIDLQVASIDKNMTIIAQLVDTTSKQVVISDTFTAAGAKQYKIDKSKYDLLITVDKANGNSSYSINLTMPETEIIYFFDTEEVPLAGYPQIAIIGSNPILLHLDSGTAYVEQGARASDYLGNDISDRVKVFGKPVRDVADTYIITYKVTDKVNGVEFTSYATREVRIFVPGERDIYDEEVPLPDFNKALGGGLSADGAKIATVANCYAVYVRKRPDPKAQAVTSLPAGATVMVTGERKGWYKVVSDGFGEGWIYGAYLNIS